MLLKGVCEKYSTLHGVTSYDDLPCDSVASFKYLQQFIYVPLNLTN